MAANRKQKTLRMSGELLLNLLKKETGIRYEVIEDGLPEDSKIINISSEFVYSEGMPDLVMVIESNEFPELQPGDVPPSITPKISMKFEDK